MYWLGEEEKGSPGVSPSPLLDGDGSSWILPESKLQRRSPQLKDIHTKEPKGALVPFVWRLGAPNSPVLNVL